MILHAGPEGAGAGESRLTLRCSGVHGSPKGLAAHIAYSVDSTSAEPVAGSGEHRMSHFVFEQQVELSLGKPTEVTHSERLQPLGEPAATPSRPAPVRITVTATEL